MKRAVALTLLASLLWPLTLLALGGRKALYMGGTLSVAVKDETEGVLLTTEETKMVFIADKGVGRIEVPYATIDSFEYGQKATFRIKTAILLTPWSLFSKKRRHYLSLLWRDANGKDAGVIFEIGKDLVRPTFLILEARTGKKTTFQDEDAKNRFAK